MVRVRMHGQRFIWISASLKQLAAFSEFMKKEIQVLYKGQVLPNRYIDKYLMFHFGLHHSHCLLFFS